MKADHPWVMKWMEVRRQRDLGITDDDIRMMRKDVAETYEDDDRTDAEIEEDDDRDAKAKKAKDDDDDDKDAEEERDRMSDAYILKGYRVSR